MDISCSTPVIAGRTVLRDLARRTGFLDGRVIQGFVEVMLDEIRLDAGADFAPGDPVDVEQVFGRDVVRGRVLAARPAGQHEGRPQLVVSSSKGPLRGGRIDQNSAGVHGRCEMLDPVLVSGKDATRVPQSAVVVDLAAKPDGVFEIPRDVKRQDRGKDLER